MEEMLDVVDNNDCLIGQEARSRCHQEKLLHRSTNILVFKDSSLKEILLQKRSLTKKVSPGLLCFPGGHLTAGDSYLGGAQREFFEEMYNLKIPGNIQLQELFKIKKSTDDDPEFLMAYRAIDAGPFNIDPIEVDSYFFEDINEMLKKMIISPADYDETAILVLNEYKRRYLTQNNLK